jgi:hypothetical protein
LREHADALERIALGASATAEDVEEATVALDAAVAAARADIGSSARRTRRTPLRDRGWRIRLTPARPDGSL